MFFIVLNITSERRKELPTLEYDKEFQLST